MNNSIIDRNNQICRQIVALRKRYKYPSVVVLLDNSPHRDLYLPSEDQVVECKLDENGLTNGMIIEMVSNIEVPGFTNKLESKLKDIITKGHGLIYYKDATELYTLLLTFVKRGREDEEGDWGHKMSGLGIARLPENHLLAYAYLSTGEVLLVPTSVIQREIRSVLTCRNMDYPLTIVNQDRTNANICIKIPFDYPIDAIRKFPESSYFVLTKAEVDDTMKNLNSLYTAEILLGHTPTQLLLPL